MRIYVSADKRAVHIQWVTDGPLTVLTADNTVTTTNRPPALLPDWSSDYENTVDWQRGHDDGYAIGLEDGSKRGEKTRVGER